LYVTTPLIASGVLLCVFGIDLDATANAAFRRLQVTRRTSCQTGEIRYTSATRSPVLLRFLSRNSARENPPPPFSHIFFFEDYATAYAAAPLGLLAFLPPPGSKTR
jgi:hypothetical protein